MRSKWLDIGRFSLKNKANIQLSWPIMVNNGLTMKNTSRMTCLYWARCERKLAMMARARFIWQFWKMEGFDRFSLCFWHISTKVNSFLARRLTLTSLVFFLFFFFRRQNCLHVFISLRLNFYIFRFLWEMFQKFTDHVSPLHAIIFLARYQAAYSVRARRAQDGIGYSITMPTDTIMIIRWKKRLIYLKYC